MRLITISGAIISFLTLGLIIQWTLDLYERDIEDLPLILALQDEIRIRPVNKGGEDVSFQGLSVNEILGESGNEQEDLTVNLAPLDQNLLENEVSPIVVSKGSKDTNIAESITGALESLLGVSDKPETIVDENIELHIASYVSADKANAHWFLLQQVNSDLLVNFNHRVVKVSNLDKELYRLRVVGFKSVAAAQDMCARLIERGEKCVPSVGK